MTTDCIPQPGDLIGHIGGRPVWLFGGADEPTVESDDADDDGADTWTPPTREEWESLQAAKKKASDESAARRKYLQAHGIDHRTGEKAGGDEPPVPPPAAEPAAPAPAIDRAAIKREIDAAVAKAVAKTELRYKPALEKNAVKAVLDASGCDPGFRDLIARSLDLTELDYDDDGNAVGLDDQIAALKLQYPQVFKKTAAAKRTGGAAAVDGGQRQPPPAAKKSWMDQINDQMNV